jgi:hypothetical protein
LTNVFLGKLTLMFCLFLGSCFLWDLHLWFCTTFSVFGCFHED